MKNLCFLGVLLLEVSGRVYADGVTDFVIDPTATYVISVSGSYRLAANVTMAVAPIKLDERPPAFCEGRIAATPGLTFITFDPSAGDLLLKWFCVNSKARVGAA